MVNCVSPHDKILRVDFIEAKDMKTRSTQWLVSPPAPPSLLRNFHGVSPLLAQLLYNRGLSAPEDTRNFLLARGARVDPFALRGIQAAVGRIRQALRHNEAIAVYGDFDADGVTSTALLLQTLTALGARVRPYIPDRVSEGYGLNRAALIRLAEAGVRLVITVDCGIRSVDEVAAGKAAGLDIIITDHHSVGDELPPASAIINPKQPGCASAADNLAGVGLAFRLAQALLRTARNDRRATSLQERELLDLVALGTVADLADLADLQNRALVSEGLRVINEAQRPGVRALLQVAGLTSGSVSARAIGYVLGPRLNAAGRLDDAMLACQLLTTDDAETAVGLAARLQALNEQRRDLTQAAHENISQELESLVAGQSLIMAGREDISAGIVGLVAGRLCEEFQRPAIVMEQGTQLSRASCRSIPQFDITHALDQCADLLLHHGGHALAAGFTVRNDNLPALRQRLTQLAQEALAGQSLQTTLDIDAEVDPGQLTFSLLDELEQLEPTGQGNPQPLFALRKARITERRVVGRDGAHLKLRLAAAGGRDLDAIAFRQGEQLERLPEQVDLAFRLERNEWNGRRRLQLNVQDIRPARDG